MSVTTTYWLIGDASGIDLGYIVRELPERLGMKSISWVFRRPFDPNDDRPNLDIEVRNLKVTPGCLGPLFFPETTLVLDDDFSELSEKVVMVQKAEIPSEVRKDVVLNRLSVEIGRGDLEFENDDETRLRRFRIGFCIWGYSTPPDCFAFEHYLLNSDGMQSLKTELEALVGPLESYILFG